MTTAMTDMSENKAHNTELFKSCPVDVAHIKNATGNNDGLK